MPTDKEADTGRNHTSLSSHPRFKITLSFLKSILTEN